MLVIVVQVREVSEARWVLGPIARWSRAAGGQLSIFLLGHSRDGSPHEAAPSPNRHPGVYHKVSNEPERN